MNAHPAPHSRNGGQCRSGRRFQALSLLVKQKRLAKTAPIPCIVRDAACGILAEDDSLAENMQHVALHPLDQFRAFQALREKGQGEEAIAAAFFVPPQIVKQQSSSSTATPIASLDVASITSQKRDDGGDWPPNPTTTTLDKSLRSCKS